MRRRAAGRVLALMLALASGAPRALPADVPAPRYAPVVAGHALAFPADYGSHLEFRTEWWYVTGWLDSDGGEPLGFQITFFRTRPAVDERNPSAFTPRQLLIAHCALSDPKHGRLWHAQKIRRAGLGLADARAGDTDVRVVLQARSARLSVTVRRERSEFAARLTCHAPEPKIFPGFTLGWGRGILTTSSTLPPCGR